MSDEERRDSLADQAAAWVPPWERPRPAVPTTPEAASPPAEVRAADEPAESSAAAELTGSAEAIKPADMTGPTKSAELVDSIEDAKPVGAVDAAESAEAHEPHDASEAREPAVAADPIDSVPAGAAGPAVPAGAAGPAVPAGGAEPAVAAEAASQGVPRREPAGRRRAAVTPEPAPDLPDAELRGALEAILLVVDEPVSELVLAQVLEQPAERIGPMLDEIAAGYTAAGHGFELRRAAGGWRLYTRPEYATYVERFVLDGQSVRLTQAALETLAVVAYKQPVTRSRISAIRGVNCDGVIRTLVTRGLVEECGTESDSGAFLYRTTTLFLEKLGLNTVDELPPLAPFLPDDVEELADATR
jgi:segregation and condensation protein B